VLTTRIKEVFDMRARRLLLVVAAAVGLMVAPMAGAAQAYTPAPSCVLSHVYEDDYIDYVNLYNDCSTTQRVKVIVAFEGDSDCRTLAPGDVTTWEWASWGSFDGVALC
jgi:Alpha amylase inhibitor